MFLLPRPIGLADCSSNASLKPLLFRLEAVEEDRSLLRLLTPVLDPQQHHRGLPLYIRASDTGV